MVVIYKIIALIMCVVMPIANFIAPPKSASGLEYKDLPAAQKEERALREYVFGENDVLVSPDGDDSADGTREAPVATIGAAKALAAKKRAGGADGHITVWIKGGEYSLGEPLVFTARDADDVSYAAVPGEKAVIDGSAVVSGWVEDVFNGKACLSAPFSSEAGFRHVIKDGKELPQNRYPESGYFYVKKTDHEGAIYTEETKTWSMGYGDLELTPDDAQKIREFKNPGDVTLRVLHFWCDDYSPVKGYDAGRGRMTLVKPMSMKVEEGQKYYYENVAEAFGAPGGWYFDRAAGRIYYSPLAGETAASLEGRMKATVNGSLIRIENCRDIDFEGLTFADTDSTFPDIGTFPGLDCPNITSSQAEYDVSGAIEATRSSGIAFRYCRFENIGNCAVKFNTLVKDCAVEGCDLHNIGATGVFIHGLNEKDDSLVTENVRVVDNVIKGYGRYFYSAIGVFITHGRNCVIEHNEISDGYYTAISIGWLWGYAFSATRGNSIRYNRIYDVGQGWLSDMGGIYTLGRQPGTVLEGNVISNVAADPGLGGYGGWGIYLDEGSQNIVVKKNLVYDCGSQGFHQHYGENNLVTNNIFALNREGQATSSFSNNSGQQGFADYETHTEYTLEKNIFLGDSSPIYVKLGNHKYADDSNLYWDLTGGKRVFCDWNSGNAPLDRVYRRSVAGMGLFKNAVFDDPGFRDPKAFDFTLPENGAADLIGFERWNYNEAGTLTAR